MHTLRLLVLGSARTRALHVPAQWDGRSTRNRWMLASAGTQSTSQVLAVNGALGLDDGRVAASEAADRRG